MNILLSSSKFLPFKGGIENSVNALALELSNLGHNVTLITSDLMPEKINLIKNEVTSFKIIRYRKPKLKGYLQTTSLLIQMTRTWKSDDQKYDLVICRDIESALPSFLKHRKSKLIYIAPGCVYKQNLTRIKEQKEQKSISNRVFYYNCYWYLPICWVFQKISITLATKVLAWSNNTLHELGKPYGAESSKYIQVNPGVDLARFKYKTATNINSQEINILMICRLDPLKNIEDAIKSLKICDFPVKLYIYGDGKKEQKRLEALSKKLGVINKVCFGGEAEKPEDIYPNADYFLMLSIYEPFGQTIIESMACGTPVIAYANSKNHFTASEKIISDGRDGYIIEPSPEALAKKLGELKYISLNEKDKVRKAARSKIESDYQWQSTTNKIIELANDN